MNAHDLTNTAISSGFAIVTLPVKLGVGAARRLSELLGRGADAVEPEPEIEVPAAREPAKPTAAESAGVVAEETDGLAEAARRS